MWWVPEPEGNRAATLRGLGADRRRQERRAHQGHASDAKEIATLHVRPPCRATRGVRAEQVALSRPVSESGVHVPCVRIPDSYNSLRAVHSANICPPHPSRKEEQEP